MNAPAPARCIDCDYPLQRIDSTRCPECGRAFDPSRPRTMNLTGRTIGQAERFFLRPRLRPLNLLAVAASIWTLGLFRWPDQVIRYAPPGLGHVAPIWWALLVVWSCLLVTMLVAITCRRRRVPEALYAQRPIRWAVFPAIGLLVWTLVINDVPFRCLWRIARPAADRWATQLLAAEPKFDYPDRHVGPFYAKHIYTDGRRVGFALTDEPDALCLVYVPPGESFERHWYRDWTPLDGGWYVARWDGPAANNRAFAARVALLEALAADPPRAARSIDLLVTSLANDALGYGARSRRLPGGLRRLYDDPARVVQDRLSPTALRLLRPDARALIQLGPAAVPALRAAVTSTNPATRLRAASILAQAGADARPAAPELLAALATDKEFPVREAAAYALGEIGASPADVSPALFRALGDRAPWVRYNAAIALRKVGAAPRDDPAALARAVAAINQPAGPAAMKTTIVRSADDQREETWDAVRAADSYTTRELIEFVAVPGPHVPAVLPQIIEALHARPTRAAAAAALRTLGPVATAALNDAAVGADQELAMQAVKVLGATASPAVVARLVALLRDPSARDAARAALVDVGPTATPLLAPLLDDDALRPTVAVVLAYADPARADLYAPVILARLPDDELRRGPASTYVYPHLGPHAAPYLARELGDRTRATCALNTLQRLGEAGAAAMGKALLRTDDWLLRCTLCERLGQLGGRARVALPMLLDLLDDTGNPVVRAAVMRAVREIGPDEATAARLEQLRTDRSPTIRDEAVRILDAIAERER